MGKGRDGHRVRSTSPSGPVQRAPCTIWTNHRNDCTVTPPSPVSPPLPSSVHHPRLGSGSSQETPVDTPTPRSSHGGHAGTSVPAFGALRLRAPSPSLLRWTLTPFREIVHILVLNTFSSTQRSTLLMRPVPLPGPRAPLLTPQGRSGRRLGHWGPRMGTPALLTCTVAAAQRLQEPEPVWTERRGAAGSVPEWKEPQEDP